MIISALKSTTETDTRSPIHIDTINTLINLGVDVIFQEGIGDGINVSDKVFKKPGIYSARWAKRSGSFRKAMINILKKIKNKKNRKARFICSLSIKMNKKKMITSVGIINGNISFKILGKRGFGYDPIFIPNNSRLTFGQISAIKKMKIDHRSIAFKKLKRKLKLDKFFI